MRFPAPCPYTSMNVKFYFGTALETLLDDGEQTLLPIYIHEFKPFVDGKLDDAVDMELLIKNILPLAQSLSSKVVVTSANCILAKYLAMQSYVARPNVHKGEQVLVFGIDDSTEFRWVPLEHDHSMRSTERMQFFVANKPEDEHYALSELNAYTFLYDTRSGQKKIEMSSNKNMGEKFAYLIRADIEAGTLVVQDDAGNIFDIDSDAKKVAMTSADGDKVSVAPGLIEAANTSGDAWTITPGAIDLATTKFTAPNIESVEGMTKFTGGIDIGIGANAKAPYVCPAGVTHRH